jgi:hypothetical protein
MKFFHSPLLQIVTNIKMNKIEEINPFIEDLVIVPGKRLIDFNDYNKNKEKHDSEGTMPYITYESADKMSVYTNPSIRIILCNMSGSALKLLIWLQQSIDYGEDLIKFNVNRFLKATNMSTSTFQRAKSELIQNQVIAIKESDKRYWWINPTIMFKGSRTKKYPDNVFVSRTGKDVTNSDSKIKNK